MLLLRVDCVLSFSWLLAIVEEVLVLSVVFSLEMIGFWGFSESPSSCGRSCVNDAHVVNLGQVSDVQVKREATSSPPPHPVQNVERVSIVSV